MAPSRTLFCTFLIVFSTFLPSIDTSKVACVPPAPNPNTDTKLTVALVYNSNLDIPTESIDFLYEQLECALKERYAKPPEILKWHVQGEECYTNDDGTDAKDTDEPPPPTSICQALLTVKKCANNAPLLISSMLHVVLALGADDTVDFAGCSGPNVFRVDFAYKIVVFRFSDEVVEDLLEDYSFLRFNSDQDIEPPGDSETFELAPASLKLLERAKSEKDEFADEMYGHFEALRRVKHGLPPYEEAIEIFHGDATTTTTTSTTTTTTTTTTSTTAAPSTTTTTLTTESPTTTTTTEMPTTTTTTKVPTTTSTKSSATTSTTKVPSTTTAESTTTKTTELPSTTTTKSSSSTTTTSTTAKMPASTTSTTTPPSTTTTTVPTTEKVVFEPRAGELILGKLDGTSTTDASMVLSSSTTSNFTLSTTTVAPITTETTVVTTEETTTTTPVATTPVNCTQNCPPGSLIHDPHDDDDDDDTTTEAPTEPLPFLVKVAHEFGDPSTHQIIGFLYIIFCILTIATLIFAITMFIICLWPKYYHDEPISRQPKKGISAAKMLAKPPPKPFSSKEKTKSKTLPTTTTESQSKELLLKKETSIEEKVIVPKPGQPSSEGTTNDSNMTPAAATANTTTAKGDSIPKTSATNAEQSPVQKSTPDDVFAGNVVTPHEHAYTIQPEEGGLVTPVPITPSPAASKTTISVEMPSDTAEPPSNVKFTDDTKRVLNPPSLVPSASESGV